MYESHDPPPPRTEELPMTDTAARAAVLQDAMYAAVTGDQALVERACTEDVTGWCRCCRSPPARS
jgi:hypothetical protein